MRPIFIEFISGGKLHRIKTDYKALHLALLAVQMEFGSVQVKLRSGRHINENN